MKTKVYTNKSVTFTFSPVSRGWTFKFNTNNGPVTYVAHCKGNEMAQHVSNVIVGSLNRGGGLDNMARANISQLVGI